MKSAWLSKLRNKLQTSEPTFRHRPRLIKSHLRLIKSGLKLRLRGRNVKLRGVRQPPTGIWKWLAILGPGLIAASAGNDAGGIATYSSTGAKYGFQLIWVMVIITIALGIVQEMCARLGAATGRGLLDLIRERFGLGWASFAVSAILLANGSLIVSEFVGIGAAMELFGFNKYVIVPLAAALIWYLVVFGSYDRVEQLFLLMTIVFFSYPLAAFLARPNWSEVARGALIPSISRDPDYIMLLVALIGTTITPYMQLFQQSAVVERGAARRHYGPEKVDAYAGAIFSNLMSISMIIATAATLHVAGTTQLSSAAEAARALEPAAGQAAKILFAVGLLGASMLAAAVLPLATSYAISEAFGFAKGVNLNFRHAPIFFSLFGGLIAIGAALAMIPNLPVIQLLLGIQVLNGMLLPVILVFVLRLSNDRRLTRELKNHWLQNLLGWATVVMVSIAVILMIAMQVLGLFGIRIFGGG